MEKSSGTTFIGLGIVLAIVGAILRFAVTATTKGVNIHTAGVIALIVGVGAIVLGLVMLMWPARRRSITSQRTIATPNGSERVEERDDISGL